MTRTEMERLREKGYVPHDWTYRWVAEDPRLPYDILRERGVRTRTFAEVSDGGGAVYVFAMCRVPKAIARRFWEAVDERARVYGLARGFIRTARAWLGEPVWGEA